MSDAWLTVVPEIRQKRRPGITCLLVASAVLLSGWAGVYTGQLLFYATLNTFIFSLLIFNEYRLQVRAEEESFEQDALQKSRGASKELFDESDESLMLASRSLNTWHRYILPVFTLLYGVAAIVWLVFKWNDWRVEFPDPDQAVEEMRKLLDLIRAYHVQKAPR